MYWKIPSPVIIRYEKVYCRSSPIGWIPSYESLYDYSTMYYSSPCEIMRLEAYPSKQNFGKIDFCRFQRDKVMRTCGKP